MVYAPDQVPEDQVAALIRRIEELERRVTEVGSADMLRTAGIRAQPGKLIIAGDLEVPNGKIKNAWLESPLNPKSGFGNEDSFALTTTPTARGAWTITVPDGYTNAFVVVNAYLQAINNSGSTQYIFVRAYAVDTDGTPHWGTRTRDTLADGFVGTPQAYLARELDGLTPGEDLTFYAEVNASAAIAADALNFAGGEALAIFTR